VRRSPNVLFVGSVNVSRAASPSWRAFRSLTATGMGGEGGVGSPGAPQPTTIRNAKIEIRKSPPQKPLRLFVRSPALHEFRISIFEFRNLEDVTAEILVLHDIGKLLVNVGGIDLDRFFLQIGSLKR